MLISVDYPCRNPRTTRLHDFGRVQRQTRRLLDRPIPTSSGLSNQSAFREFREEFLSIHYRVWQRIGDWLAEKRRELRRSIRGAGSGRSNQPHKKCPTWDIRLANRESANSEDASAGVGRDVRTSFTKNVPPGTFFRQADLGAPNCLLSAAITSVRRRQASRPR